MRETTHYKYDVFISYTREDEDWAEKLNQSLKEKKLEVFMDRHRLQAGTKWESNLLESIDNSNHMIILWSNHTRDSDWVRREIARFERRIDTPEDDSKMLFLLLEGQNNAYTSIQMVTQLRDAGVYDLGVKMIDANLWRDTLQVIMQAIRSGDRFISIPVLILTTTRDRLDQLDTSRKSPYSSMTLDNLLTEIRIDSKQDLIEFYGDERNHWRPFCGSDDVQTLLDRIQTKINQQASNVEFRWEPIGEDFWSNDMDVARNEAKKLLKDLSLIIIDPIALFDPEIRERLKDLLPNCFENEHGLVIALMPFALPAPFFHMRDVIKNMARLIYDRVYELPLQSSSPYAHFDINVADEADLNHVLVRACRSKIGIPASSSSASRYLGMWGN